MGAGGSEIGVGTACSVSSVGSDKGVEVDAGASSVLAAGGQHQNDTDEYHR